MRRIRIGMLLLALAGVSAAAACGGDEYFGEKGACRRLKGASAGPLVATSELGGAPHAELDTRYTVVLPQYSGNGGYVGFHVDAAGKHTVFLDASMPTAVFSFGGGAAADVKQSGIVRGESDECDQVKHMYQVEIGSAGDYFVRIGPSDQQQVSLVIE